MICFCGHERGDHEPGDPDAVDFQPPFCRECPGYMLTVTDGIDIWERTGDEFRPPIGRAWHEFREKRGNE